MTDIKTIQLRSGRFFHIQRPIKIFRQATAHETLANGFIVRGDAISRILLQNGRKGFQGRFHTTLAEIDQSLFEFTPCLLTQLTLLRRPDIQAFHQFDRFAFPSQVNASNATKTKTFWLLKAKDCITA
jgi:hypothetical protein